MALNLPAGLRSYSITDLPAFASKKFDLKYRDHYEQARLALKNEGSALGTTKTAREKWKGTCQS